MSAASNRRVTLWRRGRDSNPRYPLRYVRFRGGSFQPLTHLSASDRTNCMSAMLGAPSKVPALALDVSGRRLASSPSIALQEPRRPLACGGSAADGSAPRLLNAPHQL